MLFEADVDKMGLCKPYTHLCMENSNILVENCQQKMDLDDFLLSSIDDQW